MITNLAAIYRGGDLSGGIMKKLALTVASLAMLVAAPAIAADMALKAPPPVPVWSWAGFYIGINYGYSYGYSDTTNTLVHTSAAIGTQPLQNEAFRHLASGGIVGGQIGWNWQLSQFWVFGVEADWQWSGQKDTATLFGCTGVNAVGVGIFGLQNQCLTDEQKLTNFGTARARFGYATTDYFWYWTGGAAWGTVKHNMAFASTSPIAFNAFCIVPATTCGSAGSFSTTKTGWTIGTGVEVRLWNSNWTAKFEYLYVDLGSYTDTVTVGPFAGFLGTTTYTFTSSSHFRDNIIRSGINYKF